MAEKASLLVEVVENGIKKTTINLNELVRVSERAEKAANKNSNANREFGKTLRDVDSQARRTGESMALLSRVAATYLSYEAVKKATAVADSMQSMRTQIQLVTSSQREAILVQDELFNISLRTYANLEATSTLYSRTARAMKDAGKSQADFLKFTEAINNAMRIGGANATEQASALLQLSQALGSGVLQGDEFRSIAENAPILLDLVAKELGVVRGEVKALASEGKITSEIIFSALTKSADQLAKDAEKVIITTAAATENFKSSLYKYADEMLNSTGVTTAFVNVITLLGDNIEGLGDTLGVIVVGAITMYIAKTAMATGVSIANTIATLKASDAARIHAARELELALANERQARAAALAATSNAALGGSHARATQLTMAHAAAQHRLQQAQANTVSIAGGMLRMLGGPAGLIGLVASAATAFMLFSDDTDKAKASIDEILEPLDAVIKRFKELDDIRQRDAIRTYAEKEMVAIEAVKQAQKELVEEMVNSSIKAKKDMTPFWGDGAGSANYMRTTYLQVFNEAVEEAKASGEEIFTIFERALDELGLPKSVANSWVELATVFVDAEEKASGYTEALKEMNKEQKIAKEIADAQKSAFNPESIVMTGKEVGLSEQAAKIASDLEKSRLNLTNMTELQILEMKKENGELDKLKAGEYELLELRARSNDELRKTINSQSSIDSIVNGINRQYETLGMTAAQMQIFDLEALGADPEVIADMKNKLAKIGNHSFGATSIDHYNDRLQDMSRELSEIISLNKELEATGYTSQYNAVSRITLELNDQSSTLYKISDAQKQILIGQAQQIDSAHQLNAIMNLGVDYSKRLDDMAFENELIGRSAREVEALRFARELEYQAKLLSIGMSKENIAILEAETQKYKEMYEVINRENQRIEESYSTGIGKGFRDYIDMLGTTSDQTAGAITTTFGHLESSLVSFAQTSKFSFRDMTVSILNDLSKILIQIGIMQAMTAGFGKDGRGGAFGGWLSGLFGYADGGLVSGSPGIVSFSSGGYTGPGGKYQEAGLVHKDEFVFSKEATRNLGVDYLNGLHNSAKKGLRGYSGGGAVGAVSAPSFPKLQNQPQKGGDIIIHQTIHYQGDKGEEDGKNAGKDFAEGFKAEVRKVLADEKRPGGILYR